MDGRNSRPGFGPRWHPAVTLTTIEPESRDRLGIFAGKAGIRLGIRVRSPPGTLQPQSAQF